MICLYHLVLGTYYLYRIFITYIHANSKSQSLSTFLYRSDKPYLNDDVPFSCCNPESPRPCIHHHVMDNDMHYNYDFRSAITIHPIGCRDKLTEYYGQIMLTNIGVVVVCVSIFQVSILPELYVYNPRPAQWYVPSSLLSPPGSTRR